MDIQHDIELQSYNTFHLPCKAAYFVEITNIQDLQELIADRIYTAYPRLILGGGSNILLTQEHFEGLVIKNTILGKQIMSEDDTSITIRVGAGENRNEFVRWAIEQGYCGMENLVSIPGTVGAAPMQNIGAYGVEVQSIIESVQYINIAPSDKGVASSEQYNNVAEGMITLNNKDCSFAYRSSMFKTDLKDQVIITHVTFTLQKYTPDTYTPIISYGAITDKLNKHRHCEEGDTNDAAISGKSITPHLLATTIAEIRAAKLPDWKQIGTAGSFFKNPIISDETYRTLIEQHPAITGYQLSPTSYKLSAGQLIDLSGLKGLTRGPVGTYHHHALVLVHHGGGTGKDIVDLAEHIQQHVYKTFGITIEPEVNYIA